MFRLAHFSDPHLHHAEAPPSLAQRFSKRSLSRLSWARGRGALQRPELLAAAIADIQAHAPDHWLCSGDITNLSLPDEFAAAGRWLASFASVETMSIVPGNHDALVPVPWTESWAHWQPWMRGDDEMGLGSASHFPYRRVRGEVAIIGLSSAVSPPPGFASGRLGGTQLDALAELLLASQRDGLARVVMLHHPPADGVVRARKALEDRAAFRKVIARCGAELVLHGHSRDARFDPIRGPDGLVPVLGVPSISAVPNPKDEGARWNLIGLARDAGRWTIEVTARRWLPAASAFVTAAHYRIV